MTALVPLPTYGDVVRQFNIEARVVLAYVPPLPRARHTAWGRFYGYPECCIEAFIRDCEAGEYPAEKRGTVGLNGHVPCPACKLLGRPA